MRDGVALAFLDVYPDAKVLAWLARELRAKPELRALPFVVFFHYNLQDAYSDWWTAAEKAAFRDAIAGLRVLAICVGHNHATYTHKWEGRDVVCSGGDGWATVDVDDAGSAVTIQMTTTPFDASVAA